MKLQSLGIIFIVIVFPMILVLSYYLSLQIETIRLQNDYNSKLIDATNDALTAFEINTANEDLSNVSDSLRSIVDASTNTFMNTLATSLGMSNASKDMIEAYVPAILYTMYDGYYIHAPTQKPEIKEKTYTDANGIVTSEGAAIVGEEAGFDDGGLRPGEINPGPKLLYQGDGTTDDNPPGDANDYGSLLYEQNNGSYSTTIGPDTVTNTDYVLKSYMPYSATYVNGADSVTINYTLDNFISISGIVGGIYYTKSGYYIDNSIVSCPISGWDTMGQDKLKERCESGDSINITVGGQPISYVEKNDLDGNKITSIKKYEEVLSVLSNPDPTNTNYNMPLYRDYKANLDNFKSFVDMVQNIGIDGIRADVAAIKPPNFWKEIIKYARNKNKDFLFLAEANIEWSNPAPNGVKHYSSVDELLEAGFDSYYASWSDFKNE